MEIMDHFANEVLSQPLPRALIRAPAASAATTMPCTWSSWTTTSALSVSSLRFRPPVPTSSLPRHCRRPQLRPAPTTTAAATTTATGLAAYDRDIDASLRALETDARQRPSPDYLYTKKGGGRVDPEARDALVLWMYEFAEYFGIGPDALHRGVSYADRFLSERAIDSGADIDYHLRLLGAAAVYAASKYEDSWAAARVHAGDIATCCGFAASQDVLDTERVLLAALGYRLGGPTARTFVEHFTRYVGHGHGHCQEEEEALEGLRRGAYLIADASLFDHRCVRLLPSAVAAAAILLSMLCLKPSHDHEQVRRLSRELQGLTGYTPMDVYDGLDCMYKMLPVDPGFDMSPLLFADPR